MAPLSNAYALPVGSEFGVGAPKHVTEVDEVLLGGRALGVLVRYPLGGEFSRVGSTARIEPDSGRKGGRVEKVGMLPIVPVRRNAVEMNSRMVRGLATRYPRLDADT